MSIYSINLPCRAGDTIYRIWAVKGKKNIAEFVVDGFSINSNGIKFSYLPKGGQLIRYGNIDDFGKIFFTIKEEAEGNL